MSYKGYDLRVGALSLMDNTEGVCTFNTQGASATLGNPVPVAEVISSLLRDGDLTTTNRFGNREASFLVEIKAPDPGALADGEAALMAELDQVNTLTWQVPYGADTLFDVVRSWPEFMMDDLTEVRRIVRVYRVVFECLPFGRSADEVTINWTGSGTEIDLSTTAGWTATGGSITSLSNEIRKTTTTGTITLSRSVALQDYLWLKVDGSTGFTVLSAVTVDGVSVPMAEVHTLKFSGNQFFTIPTDTWRGTTKTVQFTIAADSGSTNVATLREFWTTSYPARATGNTTAAPMGIGVIDVPGSARAPVALISFTVPTGGAWLYTAPNPNVALRERGAVENLYAKWTVGGADPVYLAGDYVRVTSRSDPQPPRLNPDGIWPQYATDVDQLAYPSARGTAISFFPTSGPVSVISASPDLPTGFHPEAIVHEEHVLHPGRCGFAVIAAATGLPVAATITYYPHWWAHAGQ